MTGTGLFVRNQNVLWTELDNQFLLMDIESGAYLELTGVGSAIWRVLEASCSEADIVEHVVGRYSVERQECERDVRAFVDKLLAALLEADALTMEQLSAGLPGVDVYAAVMGLTCKAMVFLFAPA